MKRLPNEILYMIFMWAHGAAYEDGLSCPRPPVEATISAVCTGWREICLSSPFLWSIYRCITPSAMMIQLERDRLEVYLSRSHAVELELSFRFADLHCSATLMEMLDRTVEHVARWRCFTLVSDGQDNVVVPFQQSLTTLSAAKLEYLDIRTSTSTSTHIARRTDWNPKIFLSGPPPPLRFFHLDVGAVFTNFRPRLENLVHFMLDSNPPTGTGIEKHDAFPFASFIDLLKLPCLETISLSGSIWGPYRPAEQHGDVEAKRLKHLRVRYQPLHGFLSFIIYKLSAPSLESLTLHRFVLWHPPVHIASSPASPTNEPFPSLQSLHLVENIIPEWIDNNPFLRQLEKRTLYAKKLTIFPHTIRSQSSLLPLGPGNDMLMLHPYPEVEELIWNAGPKHPLPDDLKRRWPRLTRLITPAYHLQPREGIVVEELKQVEGICWPPGYKWTSCNADDPFLKDCRRFTA